MAYISESSAKMYYDSLLAFHNINFLPATKISTIKNVLESEILTEITGINHFFDEYNNNIKVRDGQKYWLLERKFKKKDRYGNPESGSIRSDIVSGIINIFEQRNIAEHKREDITETDYLGIFSQTIKIIKYFSDIEIQNEIKNILDNNVKDNAFIKNISNKDNISNSLKIHFTLIEHEYDIKNNILKFKQIIENEKDSEIIRRFSTFTYWYYIKGLNIFIPNLFLGYRDCAFTPYEKGCDTQGGDANKKLKKYFKNVGKRNLYSLLEEFVGNYNCKLNVKVKNDTIFEPKDDYIKLFNNNN